MEIFVAAQLSKQQIPKAGALKGAFNSEGIDVLGARLGGPDGKLPDIQPLRYEPRRLQFMGFRGAKYLGPELGFEGHYVFRVAGGEPAIPVAQVDFAELPGQRVITRTADGAREAVPEPTADSQIQTPSNLEDLN